ncbi:MAG: PilN domain-containing protein [Nitrospirota bacterium]
MTRRINLASEFLLTAESPASPWALVSVIGSALVIPLLVWGVHVRAASRLDPQVTELRAVRDRLTTEGTQARQRIADLEAQNARRIQEQARAEQINWLEAFRELTLLVPHGMWLSDLGGGAGASASVGAIPQDGDIPITIRGLAVSQGVVADLLVNLESASHFRDPVVMYTQREQGRGIARVGFEIQCALKRASVDGREPGKTA